MSRFRLQTALNVRERLEKLYQKSMAEQVQISQKLKDQLQILQEAEEDNETLVDQSKTQGFTINDLQMATRFRYRLQYHQGLVQEQLYEQEQVVERKTTRIGPSNSKQTGPGNFERKTCSRRSRKTTQKRTDGYG